MPRFLGQQCKLTFFWLSHQCMAADSFHQYSALNNYSQKRLMTLFKFLKWHTPPIVINRHNYCKYANIRFVFRVAGERQFPIIPRVSVKTAHCYCMLT